MAEALLEIESVRAAYGKSQVLHDVTLSVGAGELVSLIGPNGGGKSTLLKTICGWLPLTSGSIRFDRVEIRGKSPDQIVRLGLAVCPEGRRVFPLLTVEENLRMGAYTAPKRSVQERLSSVYEWFPLLKERAKQLAGSLSGGEQQMLAIGRALMARPRLILFDEPSLGLAPVLVQQMFEIVEETRRQGVTVLLVEQNAAMALRIADRAYVLDSGTVIRTGRGAELLRDKEIQSAYLGVA